MAGEPPLEFGEVSQVFKGALNPGRLRVQPERVTFKSNRSGKIEQFTPAELDEVQWLRGAKGWEMKLLLVSGNTFRLQGFKESDGEKLSAKIKKWYGTNWTVIERSVTGHNYGVPLFEGSCLSLIDDRKPSFTLPLQDVSHATTNKNEVTLEFHQNDEAPIQLVEMRFYVPSGSVELDSENPVKDFHDKVMAKADIIQATGDAIVVFDEVACLTPRGRYTIKIYPNYVGLHGKSYNFTVPFQSIVRLFLLPHTDQRQMFFVVYMDPPMRQGQTRYPFLIFVFQKDDHMEAELTLSEEDLQQYAGKLTKNLSGPVYEILSRVMKHVVGRKVVIPGVFKSHRGGNGISCSYRANHGLLYPLEKGFIFVHKPALHIRFDEVSGVNFARTNTGPSRSFDFDVTLKSGQTHTFMGMDKNEYGVLYDFVSSKKLHILNKGGKGGVTSYREDFDSDDSDQDAYLQQMKKEGAARADDTDSSEDSDYVAESGSEDGDIEFDSDAPLTDGDGSDDDDSAKGREKQSVKVAKRKRSSSKGEPKAKRTKDDSKKKKQKKDPNAPKRPMSAYLLWLNANRDRIRRENPGIGVADIAKKGGEQWKQLSPSAKIEFEQKAKDAKSNYEKELAAYKASGGAVTTKGSAPVRSAPKAKRPQVSSKVKSAEEVHTSDDESDVSVKSESGEDEEEEEEAKTEKRSTRSARSRGGATEDLAALPSEGSSEEEAEATDGEEDDDSDDDDSDD